jgi:hypothetical protein
VRAADELQASVNGIAVVGAPLSVVLSDLRD